MKDLVSIGRRAGAAFTVAAGLSGMAASTVAGGIVPYAQDFEKLVLADPSALGNDGWLVFGNVFDAEEKYLYGYGPFAAPNDGAAFCALVTGQGGPEQELQQLSVYSDYNNVDEHGNGNLVESNVYRESVIGIEDVGSTWTFMFDAKLGNIEGASTAAAFIKTIDPATGFTLTNFITRDMTAIPTDWSGYSISIDIDASLVDQLIQFGFLNVATNFEGSGIYYDNVSYAAADPAACPEDLSGSGAIDFGDILAILAAWGNPGGPADLDGSGTVDFGDILRVLAMWGPCPPRVYTVDAQNLDLTPFDDGYDGTLDSMASLSINVPDAAIIADVDVIVDIGHTWVGDLAIKLRSPAGTVVDLVSRAGFAEPADDGTGCCGLDGDLLLGRLYRFDDAAAISSEDMVAEGDGTILDFEHSSSGFMNQLGLSTLAGESSAGTWTLYVGDSAADDNGTLDGFTLEIRGTGKKE